MKKLSVVIPLLFTSFALSAAPVSGDFRTESDLPDHSTAGPLVYESIGQSIGSGYELDSSHFQGNPSGWGGGVVWMDYNTSTNILTLDSQDRWDFQTFDAWITNISFGLAGEIISGVSLLSDSLTTPSFGPTLSFTNDSLHVSYDYRPDVFDFTGGTSTFQIETSSTASVPEPSVISLLALGLAGIGFTRKKKAIYNI